jgi:magnesium chelatase subunit ChlD-like protein
LAAQTNAIDWPRTLVAKGPHHLKREHLHRRYAPVGATRLHVLLLDTSGSMRHCSRLALAKGCAAWLIDRAARAGDDLALVRFGGTGVQCLHAPGRARRAGRRQVQMLGGGGGTPLADALARADELLRDARRRGGRVHPWLWLLTDGRSLETPLRPELARHIVIVDFDDPLRPVGRCGDWAARWGARHIRPESFS